MKRVRKKIVQKVMIIVFVICLNLVMGVTYIDSKAATNNYVAEVDFSNFATEGNNLSLVVSQNPDAITEAVMKEGFNCRHIVPGNYAYFKANDVAIPQEQRDLFFEVTYFDEGTDNIALQYNSTENNYTAIHFRRTNTRKWITTTLCVENASFKNAQNSNADFRIAGEAYIRSVKIYFGKINLDSTDFGKRTGGSSYSELSDKSVAGYQAWFTTGGENEKWVHWGKDDRWPRANNHTIDIYPDVRDYAEESLRQSGFANLGSGEPAKLFNSKTDNVIDTHFSWMKEYGIDGAALQVFSTYIESRAISGTPEIHYYSKIKNAAEKNQRIFYIMYDISGGKADRYVEDIKFDWIYNVEQGCELLNSNSYATVNGKPVVCVWGMGVGDRPTARYDEIINFFKNRDCYLILGTNDDWRTTGTYLNYYNKADAISPWYVGRFGSIEGIDNFYNRVTWGDIDYCKEHNLDYYPVIWSGFSWTTWNGGAPNSIPRNAGQFIWHQAFKLKERGIKSLYIAMFDEYDEGTAIMKNASDYFDIPTDQYFVTASADGYWLSTDYQLRVVGAAIDMAKGKTPLTDVCSVAHSNGPIYYRNSFEKRQLVAADPQYNGEYPIDPCFKNPSQVSLVSVSEANTEIIKSGSAKTGEYVLKISGNANGSGANYYYKIADTKIKVKKGMTLSYSMMPENALGQNTIVSLIFDDGSRLRTSTAKDSNNIIMSAKNPRGNVGEYSLVSCTFGKQFAGKTIIGIEVGYEGDAKGSFTTYIDNIIIEDGNEVEEDIEGSFDRVDTDGFIDFSGSEAHNKAIELVTFADSEAEGYSYKEFGGSVYQQVIPSGKYAYFKVDTSCISEQDNELQVGITYLDEGFGNIVLEYNAIEGTQNTTNANYAKAYVQAKNTGEWKTEIISINNANFRKAQNNGADFRISRFESGVKIKDVFIYNDSAKKASEGSFGRTDVDAFIDFTGSNDTENHIELVRFNNEAEEGYTYKIRTGSFNQLVIPAFKYAYFKVDNSLIQKEDNELEFGITYLDEGNENIVLEYNATNADYGKAYIKCTNTGEWKSQIIKLNNANLKKAQNNEADFRISNYSTGAKIKDVFIIDDTLRKAQNGNFQRNDVDGFIDFSGINTNVNGISIVNFYDEEQEGYTYKNRVGSTNMLVIPRTKYAYFKANSEVVNETENEIKVGITYLDEGTGEIALEYNAIEGTQNTTNSRYARSIIRGTNTGEWKTEIITINNANFRKAQNNGADFRISRYNEGVSIKDVFIINDTKHKETLHIHSLTTIPAISATCENSGNSLYYKCEGCNTYFYDSKANNILENLNAVIIPAKGHTEVIDEATATCTNAGYSQGSHCSVCNQVIVAQKYVNAYGHKKEIIPAIPATENKDGFTQGEKCSVCGLIFEKQQIIFSNKTIDELKGMIGTDGLQLKILSDGMMGLDCKFHFPVEYAQYDIFVKIESPEGVQKTNIKDFIFDYSSKYVQCTVTGYVSAAQMTDKIKIEFCDAQDNVIASSAYSVSDYADLILQKEEYAYAKKLVKALLNYGAYAQLYFNYKVDDLANKNIDSAIDSSFILGNTNLPAYNFNDNEYLPNIQYYGTSLILDKNVTIRHYFNVLDDINKYKFNGGSLRPKAAGNGLYYVDIEDITPVDFGTTFYISISDGLYSRTMGYSVENYMAQANNKSKDTKLINLMSAMYTLGVEMSEYNKLGK